MLGLCALYEIKDSLAVTGRLRFEASENHEEIRPLGLHLVEEFVIARKEEAAGRRGF